MEVQKATKHEKFTLGIYFDLPQENEMKTPWQWPVMVSESKEKKMLYLYEVEKNPNFILLLLFVAILLFNEVWNK